MFKKKENEESAWHTKTLLCFFLFFSFSILQLRNPNQENWLKGGVPVLGIQLLLFYVILRTVISTLSFLG